MNLRADMEFESLDIALLALMVSEDLQQEPLLMAGASSLAILREEIAPLVTASDGDERIIEFPLESYRWYDLRRWGKLSEVLGKRGFSEGKHNFFPIPLWEVNANSALNNTTEGTEE